MLKLRQNQGRDESMGLNGRISALFGMERGVHPPHCKNTVECATVEMPAPERVVVSMLQHIGAPCIPTVAKGDRVEIGQIIGDSTAQICAPIHSGVSGKVLAISEIILPGGTKTAAVEIENDGQHRVFGGVTPPHVHSKEDLVTAVRASGLVGLGGAGFPAHVKFALYKQNCIDTLIINGAECEPYITSDNRESRENTWDIMNGIMVTAEHFNAKEIVIAIENDKPIAIAELTKVAKTCTTEGHRIRVQSIPTRYPQGAEKMLIYSTTGRRVPAGKLPSDVGCVVMNITSTAFISRYLKDGMPLVARRMTIDGNGVKNPGNLRVTIGTRIKDIVEFCGGYAPDANRIIMGGPMMGICVYTDEQPVLKQNNAILIFAGAGGEKEPEQPCIRCGRCANTCPMNLAPYELYKAYLRGDAADLEKKGVMDCVECGCCSYICPARRQLTQMMRLGKVYAKKQGGKR